MKEHRYVTETKWTGNTGEGTKTYRSYGRDHALGAAGRPDILASSDPAFRGDPSRYNPELLLVASLSSCHMLWYLHLCSAANVVVESYEDRAEGFMTEAANGSGAFTRVVLRPVVKIAATSDPAKAAALHEEAHHFCFIANSVKFPIAIEPVIARGGSES